MRRLWGRGIRALFALVASVLIGVAAIRSVDAALIAWGLPEDAFHAALNNPVVFIRVRDGEPQMMGANASRTLRLDEIPSSMPQILTAIEDRRFDDHWGVDPRGIGRALLSNLRNRDVQEGGSTLTMQLAKISFTGDYPDLRRKFVEAALALRIERAYSKEEILALYLSRVEFGRIGGIPVFGLREAAEVYFGKSPERLTPLECAVLVAMLNGPSLYDPFREPDRLARRVALIVSAVPEAFPEVPTEGAIRSALPGTPAESPGRDRFLEDHVLAEVGQLVPDLPDGWYRALTSIDPIAEWQARRVVEAEIRESARALNITQAALVTLDPEGRILAMLGGRDYARSSFNVATLGRRQPGSTAKIATYLAALEAGWNLDAMVQDDPEALTGFVPRNVDGRHRGRIPLRRCFRESRNVCTMWIAQQVQLDSVAESARRLGLAEEGDPGSSIVLGAVETSVLRNAAAFAAVANGGDLRQPQALLAVLGHHGVLRFNAPPPRLGRIAPTDAVVALRELLGEVTRHPDGTGRNANYAGGDIFGKTGTTDDNRDAWFVGFTGDGITTAVWLAGPDGEAMNHVTGGALPALIFARYNRNMHERFEAYARGEPLPR